ncbi:hypothetical protein OGZ39_11995 [Lactococcus lactis]|uniref:Uncharacterized protein n=1 Tax=Lactococcus lactis TaxID=1358 RepID=A0A9X4NF92_9LACT|nr:hypothetical protein [Lactococcus lactis]MDG4982359.1 hypothetical protein [Lactococcus lactis]THA51328.1 hypothetical protein E5555_11080 [Lactococcus lactis]
MQELILNKPDFKYKEYIEELLKLDGKDNEVHIVYDLKFLTPFTSLLVSSFLNNQKFSVSHTIGQSGGESYAYAQNFNFFHFAESSTNFEERNTNYSGAYTPIMKTIMTDYFRGQENIAESVSKKIAKVLSCDNTDIEELFFYIISELLRNIPEHSQSFDAWHCSQHWTHGNYIESEIALIDYGIGYRESLNFKESREIEDDVEAMKEALKPGVTSGITEFSHLRENEDESYLNSGYGLYVVTELCKKFDGSYVIISKSAIATPNKISTLGNGQEFPGTAIKIKIKVPKDLTKEEFKEKISDIVKDGEKLSQSIYGALNTASKKSKSILFMK